MKVKGTFFPLRDKKLFSQYENAIEMVRQFIIFFIVILFFKKFNKTIFFLQMYQKDIKVVGHDYRMYSQSVFARKPIIRKQVLHEYTNKIFFNIYFF